MKKYFLLISKDVLLHLSIYNFEKWMKMLLQRRFYLLLQILPQHLGMQF